MIGIKAITPFFSGSVTSINDLPDKEVLNETELMYYNTVGINTIYDSKNVSA
jgi:3-oxoacyl-[acyl-carrier-protein] synthase III